MVREGARAQRFSPDVVDGPAAAPPPGSFDRLSIGRSWGNRRPRGQGPRADSVRVAAPEGL